MAPNILFGAIICFPGLETNCSPVRKTVQKTAQLPLGVGVKALVELREVPRRKRFERLKVE